MWQLIWGQIKVPEPVSTASLKRLARYAGWLCLAFAAFNLISRALLPIGANVPVYDLFLAINIPLQIVCSGLFLSLSRRGDAAIVEQSSKMPIALTLTGINATMGSWIVGGSVMGLNLVVTIVLISFLRLYLTQRIAVFALMAVMGTDLVLGSLRIYDLIPFGTVLPSPELALGKSFSAAALGWRLMTIYISFIAASYAAYRFRKSEHALRLLNSELEVRVQDQVKALERASRLRRYLAPQLVEELLSAEQEPIKTRDRRPITVLFADLQNFTGLVERLPPDALADTLNFFFDQVAKVAFKHGGTIDKFIGDAVMIFFGAPRATGAADQALRCVRMAMEVQERIQELKADFIRLSGTSVLVRIGIASGIATVGDFGAEHRTDFTVVGAPVNCAARIEPLAPPGSVLIDHQTRYLIADLFQCTASENILLKGFPTPQTLYRVDAEIGAIQPKLVNF